MSVNNEGGHIAIVLLGLMTVIVSCLAAWFRGK